MLFFGVAFLTAVFLGGLFFAAPASAAFLTTAFLRAGAAFAASALFCAHRLLAASWMAFLPAAESFRLAFGASGLTFAGGSDSPRILAHRRCWASCIRRRVAAENFLRLRGVASGVVAAWLGRLGSIARTSAIWASTRFFWASRPTRAASRMEWLSVIMWLRNECTPAPGHGGGRPEGNQESSQTHRSSSAGAISCCRSASRTGFCRGDCLETNLVKSYCRNAFEACRAAPLTHVRRAEIT